MRPAVDMKENFKNINKKRTGNSSTAGAYTVLGAEDVSVLFVRRDSVYKQLGVDCWDVDRDARLFTGINPVIAHPPCRAWGQLSHFAKPLPGEKELALFAIDVIRRNGGVLEHPRASKLWPHYLPYPGEYDEYGGYSISVDQFWWGHKARKRTLLYIVGCPKRKLPLIPLRFDAIEYVVSSSTRTKRREIREISKSDRERTPVKFAKWLIEVAKCCGQHITPNGGAMRSFNCV